MTSEFDFFKILPEDKIASKGMVLISEPFLADSFFSRSVVLLVDHSDEGSFGFILNKALNIKVVQALEDVPFCDDHISMGGPVGQNTLHLIHTLGDVIPGSIKVTNDLYWGGNIEVLRDLCSSGKVNSNHVRFFLGYSGWEPGQLQSELNEDSWVIARVNSDTVMKSRSEDAWKEILRTNKKRYKMWADFPASPDMN
jgi:putative transcriptional regulator